MDRSVRTILSLICILGLIVGIVQMRDYQADQVEADASHAAALETAMQAEVPEPLQELPSEAVPQAEVPEMEPVDPNLQLMAAIDLEALRAVNPDVLGWIHIPDTVISYPLMAGDDNEEYLNRTWDRKSSKFGSIFLEGRSSRDLSDFNTIIYGHNMRTDDMFGTLLRYAEQSYAENHPAVYIATDEGVRRYDIFAAYEAEVRSDTYRLIFEDDARKQQGIDLYTESSVIESGIIPTTQDQILTLSTCTGRGTDDLRFVVQAVLGEKAERAGS